jgi:hypothetical protein
MKIYNKKFTRKKENPTVAVPTLPKFFAYEK